MGALTTFVLVTIAWILLVGVVTDGAWLSLGLASGLSAFSIGRPDWHRPLVDWSPFIVFFLAYQATRGLAHTLGTPAVWRFPHSVDAWLGGGVVPSVWLQQQLLPADGAIAWWELPVALVYVSHYWAIFILAFAIRRRSRADFTGLLRRVMVVLGVSVCLYVAVPTAPPWAAAACSPEQVADRPSTPGCMFSEPTAGQETLPGPITPPSPGDPDHLQRLTARGLEMVPGTGQLARRAIGVGFDVTDPVAAVPSLHAAMALLVAVLLWRRLRRRWWPLLVLSPLAMGFTLMWTGDHYAFDVPAGWAVVAVACWGVGALERRRTHRRADAPAAHPPRRAAPDLVTP